MWVLATRDDVSRPAPVRPEASHEVARWGDHRVVARRLGLVDAACAWLPRGEAFLARLRAEVERAGRRLEGATPAVEQGWAERPREAAPYGVLAGPVRVHQVTMRGEAEPALRAVLAAFEALAASLGVSVARRELRGADRVGAALAEAVDLRQPGGPLRLELSAGDALGRAWPLGWAEVVAGDDSAHASPASGGRGSDHMLRVSLADPLEGWAVLLLEQGGGLPWGLAPEPARVLPVSGDQLPYALRVASGLREAGLEVFAPAAGGPLAGRVRAAARDRVGATVVVGAREARSGTVSVRWGRGPAEALSLDDFLHQASRVARRLRSPGAAVGRTRLLPLGSRPGDRPRAEALTLDRQEDYSHRIS
jgi:hypothetical protein